MQLPKSRWRAQTRAGTDSFKSVAARRTGAIPRLFCECCYPCLFGSIYDVAVDLRKESETFGDWIGVELNSENNHQFWIPEGFAHGFLVTSFESKVQYKVGGYWNRKYERSLYWNDDDLNINWQLKNFDINEVIINSKDHNAATFQEIKNNGDIF